MALFKCQEVYLPKGSVYSYDWQWEYNLGGTGEHTRTLDRQKSFTLEKIAKNLKVQVYGELGGEGCDHTSLLQVTLYIDGVSQGTQTICSQGAWNESGYGEGSFSYTVTLNKVAKGTHTVNLQVYTGSGNGMYVRALNQSGDRHGTPTHYRVTAI